MNRDNALFVLIGLLTGFIAGYLTHEVMVQHQPPPASRLAAAGATAGTPAAGGNTSPTGAQPAMEQVQRLRQYVEENPQDTDALRLLANLNYDIQNWSRAAELYETYLEVHADDIDVRTDLGASLRYLGRQQEALEQFEEVLRRDPEHWQALYNQILVLAFDLKDFTAADRAMARLRDLQPSNPDVEQLAAELERRRGA